MARVQSDFWKTHQAWIYQQQKILLPKEAGFFVVQRFT